MFEQFMDYFNEKGEVKCKNGAYNDFLTQLGGRAFGKGMFNSFSSENVDKWSEMVEEAFPDMKGLFKLFGYDWLGRCFGIDLRERTNGNILLFEIGTNDILEIPYSFEKFFNEEIPYNAEVCLAKTFFIEWMNYSHMEELPYGRCIGYKLPLFLGGADLVDNLEDSDMEIYWGVITQIKHQI